MSEYKGYVITPSSSSFFSANDAPYVIYSVRKDETLVRDGIVYGPFKNREDALSAAETAARQWIDEQGK